MRLQTSSSFPKTKPFLFFAILVFLVDRISKFYVGSWLTHPVQLSSWCTLLLLHNRGVSWSLFASESAAWFWMVTAGVGLLIAIFAGYMWVRWMNRMRIGVELLLLSAALSNFCDRFLYGGVRDFILLHYYSYSWPVFNIADIVIVCAVCFLLFDAWTSHE